MRVSSTASKPAQELNVKREGIEDNYDSHLASKADLVFRIVLAVL